MTRKNSGSAHVRINLSDNTGQLCIREVKVSGASKLRTAVKKLQRMLEGQPLENVKCEKIITAAKKQEKTAEELYVKAAEQIKDYQAMFVGHAGKRSHLRTE